MMTIFKNHDDQMFKIYDDKCNKLPQGTKFYNGLHQVKQQQVSLIVWLVVIVLATINKLSF